MRDAPSTKNNRLVSTLLRNFKDGLEVSGNMYDSILPKLNQLVKADETLITNLQFLHHDNKLTMIELRDILPHRKL